MSDYVKSTNFYVKDSLLVGNPDKIVKGSELDTEFNNIATAVASKANYASPNFTGIPTAPTAPQGTNTSQLATTAFVFANSVPVGAIILWSGSIATIPSGYSLCDGSNGTPNLRDRFIVGAGTAYAVGALGGSADAVVVSHTHIATVTDPGHTHVVNRGQTPDNYTEDRTGSEMQGVSDIINTNSATTGITVSNSSTGVSGTNANLPPYYALCYIMKL